MSHGRPFAPEKVRNAERTWAILQPLPTVGNNSLESGCYRGQLSAIDCECQRSFASKCRHLEDVELVIDIVAQELSQVMFALACCRLKVPEPTGNGPMDDLFALR